MNAAPTASMIDPSRSICARALGVFPLLTKTVRPSSSVTTHFSARV
jgi:hypothetical protein